MLYKQYLSILKKNVNFNLTLNLSLKTKNTLVSLKFLFFILVTANISNVYASSFLDLNPSVSCEQSLAKPDLFPNQQIYNRISEERNPAVKLSHTNFMDLLINLRNTLSGNLATVYRSEWKAKLTVYESNQFVSDLITELGSKSSNQFIFGNIESNQFEYVRRIHQQLAKLQIKRPQSPIITEDMQAYFMKVRDMIPPAAAQDFTFTYYLGALKNKDGKGEGKHQVRIRNYIRVVETAKLELMNLEESIDGYSKDGSVFLIKKMSPLSFNLKLHGQLLENLNLNQITQILGSHFKIFAPHGGKYKLEVKSALQDIIKGDVFPLLSGPHMVQKLDIGLTPQQFIFLFADIPTTDEFQLKKVSLKRIEELEVELLLSPKNNPERVKSVLAVLKEGVSSNSKFLKIIGATFYHRSAFESPTIGFQMTVDRDQKVFYDGIYQKSHDSRELILNDPFEVLALPYYVVPMKNDERHVELKIPYNNVIESIGLLTDLNLFETSESKKQINPDMEKILRIYSKYLKNNQHRGKFNYLIENGIYNDFD